MKRQTSLLSLILLCCCLSACSLLPDWMGDSEAPPLPGDRISLTAARAAIMADEALADQPITLPQMPTNASWPQALGNATGVSGNLKLSSTPAIRYTLSPGDGTAFEAGLIPHPIIGGNKIFAMDGAGIISAYDAENPDRELWSSDLLHHDEDSSAQIGGGLAWARNRLFATGAEGRFVALDSDTGALLWKKSLKLPLRTPPRVSGDKIFLLTADNRLLALHQSDGSPLWSHQGIHDITVTLHAAVPAIRNRIVLVIYSTGEIMALDQESGQSLWSDQLHVSTRSDTLQTQSHVSPVMAQGLSFLSGSERIAAYETTSGRRVWEREVPVKQAPWLAGNSLFLQTTQQQIVAMRGTDGGIHWTTMLAEEEDGRPIHWHGPVIAGDILWMAGSHGALLGINPQTGEIAQKIRIPSGVMTRPVIANSRMHLLTQDAEVIILE
jgi:outer membrane protein assembly factor BamB